MGFIGIESVDSLNNAVTDSFTSEDGSYGGSNRAENGGLCSKGPVTLASGADVFGNAQGSSVNQLEGSGTSISGSQISTPIPDEFDSIDFDSVGANDNDRINTESPPPYGAEFYNPNTRELVIDQGKNLTLTSGTYHFSNLYLRGGSQLRIDGQVEIFIEQEMRFDNGTVANLSQTPDQFKINVGAGPVNIQGGNQLHAAIYAPDADVRVENGSGFFGGIIGKTLTFAGGGGLHYDESLGDDQQQNVPPRLVY